MSSQAVIDALIAAYNAEIETVMNYIANATNLDGVRAKHIKNSLEADVAEELSHAQMLAKRIKIVGGEVPGSKGLSWTQDMLQPPAKTTDVLSVIKGVIAAEEGAIAGYRTLIKAAQATEDFASEDLAITLMADEEDHRREFIGFLKEFEDNL